jgi:hypothetical protein
MTSGHARRAPRQSIATWVCTLAVGVGLVACHRIHCKLENKTMATNDATTIPSIPGASAAEPFSLEYSIEAEGAVGTDLSRIKTTLLVRGSIRQAALEKHRSQSDQAGEAIGTFQAEVSEQELANLRAKAHATIVPALPPRDGMGPGSSIITLKLQEGATLEVVLKPGATFTAETVSWTPGMPKRRFLAQGGWSDYTGSGTCQDMYRVRGATFSEALKLMPADLD